MSAQITVYVKTESQCRPCEATIRKLKSSGYVEGIDYTEVSAEDNLYKLKELGMFEAPVVMVNGHEPWSGYRPDLIEDIVL